MSARLPLGRIGPIRTELQPAADYLPSLAEHRLCLAALGEPDASSAFHDHTFVRIRAGARPQAAWQHAPAIFLEQMGHGGSDGTTFHTRGSLRVTHQLAQSDDFDSITPCTS